MTATKKTFSDEEKLKEISTSKYPLKEMLKVVPQAEEKFYQRRRWKFRNKEIVTQMVNI